MHRVALDIETIPLVDDPDFSDPSDWTIFAVALGHQAPDRSRPCCVDVLFRTDSTLDAEAQLLHDTIDWIAARTDPDSRELVTYNGGSYDLPILKHRASTHSDENPGDNVVERLYLLTLTADHVDLMDDMRERRGYHVSLDDALDAHGIDADAPTWNGEKVTGAHMPEMGLELLSNGEESDLKDVVRRYAASDVEPLFELRRALRGDGSVPADDAVNR